MDLDRKVLETILLANRISAEKELAEQQPKQEIREDAYSRIVVQDLIERIGYDIQEVSSMLIRGGYCAPELAGKAMLTAIDYLNDRGQYIKVFPYEFMARRIASNLGIVGPNQAEQLAEYVTKLLEKMGLKQLKAKARYGYLNAYIVTK